MNAMPLAATSQAPPTVEDRLLVVLPVAGLRFARCGQSAANRAATVHRANRRVKPTVVVGEERAGPTPTELAVVPDRCGECKQSLDHPGHDAAPGASAVVF